MNRATLPTTDLYFLNSCGSWVRRWLHPGPIERLGANSFRCGDHFLLIRRDEPDLMRRALDWAGRLIYLIDDDIDAASQAASLPESYRHRLGTFAASYYHRLLRRADIVVASSAALTAQLANDHGIGPKLRELVPYWGGRIPGQEHFAGCAAKMTMIHLGSASHSGGLAAITPTVRQLIDEVPHLTFTYIGPRGLSPTLEGHDRIRRVTPMRWPRYRRWLVRQRFHLAIYPLEAARFDRARSANKLLEHNLIGAAGMYPSDWTPAAMAADGAIMAPPDPAQWYDCLRATICAPAELPNIVQKASAALTQYGSPDAQQQFWRQTLNLDRP